MSSKSKRNQPGKRPLKKPMFTDRAALAELVAWDRDYMTEYPYLVPISEALTIEFGVPFNVANTGDGCICLESGPLEDRFTILVGSADGHCGPKPNAVKCSPRRGITMVSGHRQSGSLRSPCGGGR